MHIPGQIILFAGAQPPPGTLACDGSAVLRNQYPALFAAIGETYGAGDGQTTFHLPNIPEGFALLNTQQGQKVGTTTSGENKRHSHETTVSSDGQHAHSASSNEAGKHTHTASSTAAGSHAHSASSGAAGNHVHSAWTDAQGAHSHTYTYHTYGTTGRGKGHGIYNFYNNPARTSSAGNHAHNVGIGASGNHAHSISIAANGQHVHGISVAENGRHAHAVSVAVNGQHSHTVTPAASGGDHNRPAGLFIRCCIAY